MKTSVALTTTVHLVSPTGSGGRTTAAEMPSVPVPVRLLFERSDPFAVHMVFTIAPGREVRWVFARDLLLDGLLRPAGEGDVRVWPSPDGTTPQCAPLDGVFVELSSPSGQARFEASATTVARFLDETLEVVPSGTESSLVDVDAALAALLTPNER